MFIFLRSCTGHLNSFYYKYAIRFETQIFIFLNVEINLICNYKNVEAGQIHCFLLVKTHLLFFLFKFCLPSWFLNNVLIKKGRKIENDKSTKCPGYCTNKLHTLGLVLGK